MTMQTLTLQVPEILFTRLQQRAQQANRTVEAETLDLLATAVPVAEELPADLEQALTSLGSLEDEALRRAAQNGLAVEAAEELEALHFKRQREGLTEAETQRQADLVRQYKRTMLVRARAAVLLRQRGHDVSNLVPRS